MVGCESEDKLERAEVSAQQQNTQLQTAQHEAQAYWDNKSQIMLIVAKASNEDPAGAKDHIEKILQVMNKKNPQTLRKLASNPESLHKLQRQLLRSFRTELLSKAQLEKFHADLGTKLKEYYASQGEKIERREVSVRPGQTLCKISTEVYQTPRRWTEIYLVNQDHIANWDIISVGQHLDVYVPKQAQIAPVATEQETH